MTAAAAAKLAALGYQVDAERGTVTATFKEASHLSQDQAITLDLVLNGELSMTSAVRRARENGEDEFANYLRNF